MEKCKCRKLYIVHPILKCNADISSIIDQVFLSAISQDNRKVLIYGGLKVLLCFNFFNLIKHLIPIQVARSKIILGQFGLIDLLPDYRMQVEEQRRGASDRVSN